MNPELIKLLELTGDLYKNIKPADSKACDPDKLFHLARLNRLLFCILRKNNNNFDLGKLSTLDSDAYIKKGNLYLQNLRNSLLYLNEILGCGNFIAFKTFYYYPRITNDIDIIVDDYKSASRSFLRDGWWTKQILHSNPHFNREGYLKVGVHEKAGWGTKEFMDQELIWKNTRSIKFKGIDVRLSSIEVDMMTIIPHIPFEKCYFDLGELLYIYKFADNVNWSLVKSQAQKYHWYHTLLDVLSYINGFHRVIYQEPSPIESSIPVVRDIKVKLPYEFPFWNAIKAHIEKKEFRKLLSSLYGFQIIPYLAGRHERKN
jgi:putative nucleotidyltransferase-like protein